MKKILGISAFYHDAAAAIIVDDKIIAAVQEERFVREKHTADFPIHSIKYCLEEAGLTLDELDAVTFYDKPFLKFERLLQTYYAFAPKGLISFLKAIPVWISEKLFLKKMIRDGLNEVESYNKKELKLLFSEHHLSHAASAFFPSPHTKAAILTIDGVGEWCTGSIGVGEGNKIKILKELEFPHSVGLLYSAFTYFLGFKVNSGEYKLMGLTPYGNLESEQTQVFIKGIKTSLIDLKEDGSIWMDQTYFNYATGLCMIKEKKWERLFGMERRAPESKLEQQHCDLALAIQKVTEEIVIKMAKESKAITGVDHLCMAGGVALNCVANGKLIKENIFEDIYIQPAAGDAGGALGAALATNYMYFDQERKANSTDDEMYGAYLGPDFSSKEILLMSRKFKAVSEEVENYDLLADRIGALIAKGNIVGWFQGRMEFGPRALGNRSILADATNLEMQKKLNLKIKYREGFRPFAPSVLSEDVSQYFDLKGASPYMLVTASLKEEFREELPESYSTLSMWDKLYLKRSKFQAITHLDFSARIQTVHQKTNPRYWGLINAVKKHSGHGMVVNTSFNVRGESIVHTPEDAYRCFMSTDMDCLVINNYLYLKNEQPDWESKDKWRMKFEND